METFVLILHYIFCVAMIVIVLLQADQGEGLSGAFGGGASSAIFGKRGATGFVAKITTTAAIAFMLTSFVLTWMASHDMVAKERRPASGQPTGTLPPLPEF
ncbi:MAG: preprotein translocase subunit SecG [Candidatus Riflebacteria bacterium]|nr:preprotein translocase subunit SecG [Candidatus Riflebacteria bacterium]